MIMKKKLRLQRGSGVSVQEVKTARASIGRNIIPSANVQSSPDDTKPDSAHEILRTPTMRGVAYSAIGAHGAHGVDALSYALSNSVRVSSDINALGYPDISSVVSAQISSEMQGHTVAIPPRRWGNIRYVPYEHITDSSLGEAEAMAEYHAEARRGAERMAATLQSNNSTVAPAECRVERQIDTMQYAFVACQARAAVTLSGSGTPTQLLALALQDSCNNVSIARAREVTIRRMRPNTRIVFSDTVTINEITVHLVVVEEAGVRDILALSNDAASVLHSITVRNTFPTDFDVALGEMYRRIRSLT